MSPPIGINKGPLDVGITIAPNGTDTSIVWLRLLPSGVAGFGAGGSGCAAIVGLGRNEVACTILLPKVKDVPPNQSKPAPGLPPRFGNPNIPCGELASIQPLPPKEVNPVRSLTEDPVTVTRSVVAV